MFFAENSYPSSFVRNCRKTGGPSRRFSLDIKKRFKSEGLLVDQNSFTNKHPELASGSLAATNFRHAQAKNKN